MLAFGLEGFLCCDVLDWWLGLGFGVACCVLVWAIWLHVVLCGLLWCVLGWVPSVLWGVCVYVERCGVLGAWLILA